MFLNSSTYEVIDFGSIVGIEYLFGELKIVVASYDKSGYSFKDLHKISHDEIFSCISNMLKRHGLDHDIINFLVADGSNDHDIVSLVYDGVDMIRSVKFGAIFEKNDVSDESTHCKVEIYGNKSTIYIRCKGCKNKDTFNFEDSFVLKHNSYGYLLVPSTSM